MHPNSLAALITLQTQIRILVMAKHVFGGKTTEALEPGTIDRDKCARYRRHTTRLQESRRSGWGALSVMLDPYQLVLLNPLLSDRHRGIKVEIHAAMHQRAVIIIERYAKNGRLVSRQIGDDRAMSNRPFTIAWKNIRVDDQNAVAARLHCRDVVRRTK